jgi:hypothetical protein
MLGAALALGVSSAGLRAAEIGKYVPKDTQWLISVNVRQIFDSAVVKKHGTPQLKKVLENSAEVQGALSQLGYDPLTDLSRVVIALPAVKDVKEPRVTAIFHGKFDLDKFHQAASGYAQQKPDELKVEKHGDTPVYELRTPDQAKPMFGAFLGKDTLVTSNSKDAVLEALALKTGDKKAAVDKDLEALVAKIPAEQSVWAAGIIPEDVRKQLADVVGKSPQAAQYADVAKSLRALTATVKLGDGALAKVQIHTNTPQAAETIRGLLVQGKAAGQLLLGATPQLANVAPVLTDILESIKVTKDDKAAQIAVDVSAEAIDKAAKAQQENSK